MSFYPSEYNVPDILQATEFVLVPLTPAHVELDYEAVMASREMLRLWAGGTWPREGFTLAENLKDLEWHDREQRERTAFTYSVLDPGQESCLGCLYIRPLRDLAAANPEQLANIGEDEAMLRFWVRSSLLTSVLEQRLLDTLINWFAEEWRFSRFLFHTRQVNLQQVLLFESAHLAQQMKLSYSERGGNHIFFGVVPYP